MNEHLARRTDPATSKAAAKKVNTTVTETHKQVLRLMLDMYNPTEDNVCEAAVDAGVVQRHEQARRIVRTLRDKQLVIPAIDGESGWQLSGRNSSGCVALAWTLSYEGICTAKYL